MATTLSAEGNKAVVLRTAWVAPPTVETGTTPRSWPPPWPRKTTSPVGDWGPKPSGVSHGTQGGQRAERAFGTGLRVHRGGVRCHLLGVVLGRAGQAVPVARINGHNVVRSHPQGPGGLAVDAAATELEIRGPGALDVESPVLFHVIGAPTSVPAPSTKVTFTT